MLEHTGAHQEIRFTLLRDQDGPVVAGKISLELPFALNVRLSNAPVPSSSRGVPSMRPSCTVATSGFDRPKARSRLAGRMPSRKEACAGEGAERRVSEATSSSAMGWEASGLT